MKDRSFFYDEFSDRLMISTKKNTDMIKGSVRFLNLTIDFTTENKIANIEIKHISEYIASIGINPLILKELDDVKLVFKSCRDGYLIYFIFKSMGKVEKIPYNIQAKAVPVLC